MTRFVYDRSVDVEDVSDVAAARVAAAIGAPARASMLYSLMDGSARTSTELAVIAEVSPSTASVHLDRLTAEHLLTVVAQGKHRYYRLRGREVARMLECLSVVAGGQAKLAPSTPNRLRVARTCYDHMAGTVAVSVHDRLLSLGWLSASQDDVSYQVTTKGDKAFAAMGIDVARARASRRRFSYGCIDWSERRPHVAGAMGAALLNLFLRKRWVAQELDSRALSITNLGRREMQARFGVSPVV